MGRAGLDVEVVRAGLERTEEHVVGNVFQEAPITLSTTEKQRYPAVESTNT